MTRFALRALPVALLALSASIARADDIPNNTFRIGEYWVFYHAYADNLSGPFVPSDLNLSRSSDLRATSIPCRNHDVRSLGRVRSTELAEQLLAGLALSFQKCKTLYHFNLGLEYVERRYI